MYPRSLETEGHDAYIRPWVWVSFLFMGPLVVSICFQVYIYLGTLTMVRAQAILTELVFEHSFRIRFKAEASVNGHTSSTSTSPRIGADSSSVTEDSGDETQSVPTESTAPKGKGMVVSNPSGAPGAPSEPGKKDNLVGKINTLVTVDVDNILSAKDFLMLCAYDR